jgi:hypothetical protein
MSFPVEGIGIAAAGCITREFAEYATILLFIFHLTISVSKLWGTSLLRTLLLFFRGRQYSAEAIE